jgi:dipeptidyl aminopeptidase/acylaminoacyl peptidase
MAETTTRRIQPEDLFKIDVINEARVSPDGRQVAYVVQRTDMEGNQYRSAIHLVDASTGEGKQFTTGTHRDGSPRWSPDGATLAFVSDRSGKSQIYLIDVDGGEPRQLTSLSRGAAGPVWSEDGAKIAFLSTEGNGIDDEERDKPGGMIRHITRQRYRFDVTGYIDDRFPHVWYVDVASGQTQQVTWGAQPDASPTWSPDGRRIAFVTNRENEVDLNHISQLYVVDVPEPGSPISGDQDSAQRIETGAEMHVSPTWSPDGSRIAFIGRRSDAPAGANNEVYAVAVDGSGNGERLTTQFDRCVGLGNYSDVLDSGSASLFWAPDGNAIRFSANDKGRVGLYEVTSDADVGQIVGGDRTGISFTQSDDGSRIAFVAGTFTNPCDVYICDGDGANERRLTSINDELLSVFPIQHPEHMPFESFDGWFTIDAWLVRPVDYDPDQQYPLVQFIHGGPHSVFGHVFFFDVQLWASQGWNVLFINPRATQSYGEEFATACLGDWGGADWKEQEQALDLAIERGGVDPDRLAVTGLSYGGFMTNWIVGQTDRYRVGVSENSICNLVSFMFTSDIGWAWLEKEMEKEFWSNVDWYMERSPITYVPNVKTPVLLLQSETDWRCPIEQGEQFFQALRHRGIDSEMVRFPGETHGVLRSGKPESRLQRRQHTLRWFEKYL